MCVCGAEGGFLWRSPLFSHFIISLSGHKFNGLIQEKSLIFTNDILFLFFLGEHKPVACEAQHPLSKISPSPEKGNTAKTVNLNDQNLQGFQNR